MTQQDKNNSISLDSLRSSKRKQRNIDGKELRDFGNGKKEFDPEANGFFPEVNERKSDKDVALELFDKQLEERRAEVEHFNALIDKYDGVLTEEDYLRETGKEYILSNLNSSMTDKERAEVEAERAENRRKKEEAKKQEEESKKIVNMPVQQNTQVNESDGWDDLDELEKEILSEEENIMPIAKGTPIVGEINKQELRKQNTVQPMGTTDTFVDPNLSRKTTLNDTEKVNLDKLPPDTETVSDDELEEEILMDNREEEKEQPVNVAVETVEYVAPVQKATVYDEHGMSEEEKDLAALDDEESLDEDSEIESYWKKIGSAYNKKVKPVVKKLDLNATVVSSEPVTVSSIINRSSSKASKVYKWALLKSGRPVTVKSFTAAELNDLGTMAGSAARAKEIIKALWDHIVEGGGDNFDQWCKTTSHKDLPHLWFAAYAACFEGANYVPYVCDKCKEATVSDNLDILSMVKYKDDSIKETVREICNMNYEPNMGKISPVSRIQISDDIVIDFKDPSVYDILTVGLLDNATQQKYSEGAAMVPYISNIYAIDTSSGTTVLRPLLNKTYPGNEAKTIKRKAIEFSMIIRSLNTEQYSLVSNYITSLAKEEEDLMTYQYPEYTCDHCHETIPAMDITASEMVFTRHRLALIES